MLLRPLDQPLATAALTPRESPYVCVRARVRPLNIVCIMQDGKLIIKLIDFDASAAYGELCHLKFSSAYAPPQLAAELLAYESSTGHKPTDASAPMPWAEWVQSNTEHQ